MRRRRVYLCPKCGKTLPICLPPYARRGDSVCKCNPSLIPEEYGGTWKRGRKR